MDWRSGSSGRAPTSQAQSSEFKFQSHQNQNVNKNKNQSILINKNSPHKITQNTKWK
jgi:hypothetical protein